RVIAALALLSQESRLNVRKVYLLVFIFLSFQTVSETMCSIDDKAIFACEIGHKNVSACLKSDGQVTYVYGVKGKSEIELSSPKFSSGGCSGGGESRLRFVNGDYSYILYDVMCNSEQIGPGMWSKTDYAGLYVLKGKEVILNKECTGFSEGILGVNSSLIPHIKIEEFNYDL
uniref:hypothetical protein n=1 Tax=Aliivibrio fischeri TaxID=668 RepID=UPI000B1D0618